MNTADKNADETILTVIGGKAITVETFPVEDIMIVGDETYDDLNDSSFRPQVELDYWGYGEKQKSRDLQGAKLVVHENGQKGFVMWVNEPVFLKGPAEQIFRDKKVIVGEKLFRKYETPQQLREIFTERAKQEGIELAGEEPQLVLHFTSTQPFTEEKVTSEVARRALDRVNVIVPKPKIF